MRIVHMSSACKRFKLIQLASIISCMHSAIVCRWHVHFVYFCLNSWTLWFLVCCGWLNNITMGNSGKVTKPLPLALPMPPPHSHNSNDQDMNWKPNDNMSFHVDYDLCLSRNNNNKLIHEKYMFRSIAHSHYPFPFRQLIKNNHVNSMCVCGCCFFNQKYKFILHNKTTERQSQ